MTDEVRLEVDPIVCTGHGLCACWLPSGSAWIEWGYPILEANALTPDLVRRARRAADECPVRALRLRR